MTIPYQTTAITTDHEQSKAIVEPYRHVFKSVLENIKHECVAYTTTDTTTNPATIILHADQENTWGLTAKGRAAFSPETPYELQSSIMNFSFCDMSSFCFLPWITEALRPMRAFAECLLICPVRPEHILCYANGPSGSAFGRHSVFVITTASREQYIADFTLEQYGLPAESWFLEKSEYMQRFTEGVWCIASEEDLDETDEMIASQPGEQHIRNCINAVCEEVNLPVYRSLPVDERMPWVEALTKEIMERVEAKAVLAVEPEVAYPGAEIYDQA